MLVALSGVFGFGPLSEATSGEDALTIEYERFLRITSLVQFRVRFAPAGLQEQHLQLSEQFAKSYEITDIEPRPVYTSAGAQGLQLTFTSKVSEPLTVIIWAHPRSYGTVHIEARADAGAPIQLSSFIYP